MTYTYEIELRLVVVGEETRRTIDRSRWELNAINIDAAAYNFGGLQGTLDSYPHNLRLIREPRYPHTYEEESRP